MSGQIKIVKSRPVGSGGRELVYWRMDNGNIHTGLCEWTTMPKETLREYVRDIKERIPTGEIRTKEVHTLEIFDGFCDEATRTGLVYRCNRRPKDLREILLKSEKFKHTLRRSFSRDIATQIRSLHVHFQLPHNALRTESFVFFFDDRKHRTPCNEIWVLDWARPPSLDIYQHPEYQADKPAWFYQAWSLMMVLSEIATWEPLDGTVQDKTELLRMRTERKQLLTSSDWEDPQDTKVFQFGFGVLEKDRETLEKYSHWQVKRFYDRLCDLLA
ncbi:hypothetical protein F5B20DRAFT_104120 [Whalleya microplaca]|nr:hypothetical protein F5B20DRAFT_104120 [Whalleya microplaca]